MITTFYPPYHFGGDGNYVRQMAHILAGLGHQVDIIHDIDAYRLLSNQKNPPPLQEPEGVNVFGLQSRIGALSCFATQQLGYPVVHGKQIRSILKQRKPDIIHFHNISLVGGPGILAYGDALKIYTAHEHWLVCPSHILWRHNREVCTGKQCLRCVVNYHRPPQIWRYTGLIDRAAKSVDAFCSPSHFSANKHKEFGFTKNMTVMPSFLPDVPPVTDDHEIKTAARERPYFLFVGRLEIIKGIQDIIPLFVNDAPADLWIAGTGDYEQELKRLANGSVNIHFLGQTASEVLRPMYANAIAAITPSRCYEVFPLVVLEAFREATPIIARELGPYPEIIQRSQGGFLFNTQQELSNALTRLSADSDLRNKMGLAGYNTFQEEWSEQAAMSAYFGLIKQLANQRKINKIQEVLSACDSAGKFTSPAITANRRT
ncbi:MAG: glycosyltransferase family 4 protein [Gammaproteobacteria bacterium]